MPLKIKMAKADVLLCNDNQPEELIRNIAK